MKHLIPLLLLFAYCRAQEYSDYDFTKVTAYRMMDVPVEGEGQNDILEYIKAKKFVGFYIQAQQTTDRNMAYELLRIKRESAQWPRLSLVDTQAYFYPRNMIVVEVNQFKDTLYTDAANYYLYRPVEQALYADTLAQINNACTPHMRAFFERDFEQEFNTRTDSIMQDRVAINGKSVFGLGRKGFEKKIGPFQASRTDSVFGPQLTSRCELLINNMGFRFEGAKNRISSIRAFKIDHEFEQKYDIEVDGIKLGDAEAILHERYPNATRIRNWGAPLQDIANNYYYIVEFTGTEGYVLFYNRNSVVNEIEVSF
jgi:hypothetical protein